MSTLLLAGCSIASAKDDAPTVGALGKVTAHYGTACTPLTRDGHTYNTVHNGWTSLTNSSTTSVTIKQVTMQNLSGVRVTGAHIGPILDKSLIGSVAGPPTPATRRTLARSRPAVGAKIAPGDRKQLIVDLAFQPGHGGHTGPVRVLYTDTEGNLHQYVGGISFRFIPTSKCA